jgi:hypothetical protein
MYQLAKSYYEAEVLARYGTWWDNAIQQDFAQWENRGWLGDEQTATYHYIGQPVFYFMSYTDAASIQDDFPVYYTNRINSALWSPLSAYAKTQYGSSLDTIVKQNVEEGAKQELTNSRTWIAVGILAAIGFGFYIYKKKG